MTPEVSNSHDARKVELVLSQLDALPPLAPIAARILALTEDSRSNARQIIELISADPALTARVLSILGRAEHGMKTKALSIENAVVLLGFSTIRQITLALKVMEVFGPASNETREEGGFDRAEFWKHCLCVACAAREIATALPRCGSPDEAFVHGLLHDIGKIALDTAMPKAFHRIAREANEHRADIADMERRMLGVDHAVIGRRLAEKWGLPRALTECIWLHHQHPEGLPDSIASGLHVQVVQLADTIAREQRIGYSGNHRFMISSRILATKLGLTEKQRQAIVTSLVDEIERRAAWIGSDSLNTREVYLRALQQSTEELTATNTELSLRNACLVRQSVYFNALESLSRNIAPRASVRDVCAVGAAVLREVLGVERVHVHVVSADGQWTEWGTVDGAMESGIEERDSESVDASADVSACLAMARAGVWLTPPSGSFAKTAERLRLSSTTPAWLFPIVWQQRWIGAAIFQASAECVARQRGESKEMEALSGAIGLAIAQAQSHSAAAKLGDELAEVNRRLGTVESELLAAKNLETVVHLAAGAAHELNNPLAVIAGRAQMLLRSENRPDVRESLEIIARQARSCSTIVTEMMEFARSAEPTPAPLSLRKILAVVATELSADGLLANGQLDLASVSDSVSVWFDEAHLRGILLEILRNGIEASDPSARRLSVKTMSDSTEDGVVVQVIDNGRGMTADVLDRAMEPFFSDRPAGRGRGLGLARVRRWLHQGGGRIRLDSEPGKGTIVELRLPKAGS